MTARRYSALALLALSGCASPNSGPYILPNPRCIIGCEAVIVTQPIDSVKIDDDQIDAKPDPAKAPAPAATATAPKATKP